MYYYCCTAIEVLSSRVAWGPWQPPAALLGSSTSSEQTQLADWLGRAICMGACLQAAVGLPCWDLAKPSGPLAQSQEMIGSLNTSNAVVAFEKMEEKVGSGCGCLEHGCCKAWGCWAPVVLRGVLKVECRVPGIVKSAVAAASKGLL